MTSWRGFSRSRLPDRGHDELLTSIDGASSLPVRRIVVRA
jgi:hypothetical protein